MQLAPDRVAGLALMDTAYTPRSAGEAGEQEKAERYALLNKARLEGMRAMGLQWVQKMVHPARLSDKPLIDAILDMIARKTPEIFAAQIKALLETPGLDAVAGNDSLSDDCSLRKAGRVEFSATARAHGRRDSNSRLVVIEDCGHMSTMERPRK